MSTMPLFQPEAAVAERRLAKSDRLLRLFEDIHNHIYANDGLSPEQTFAEMMKILALKVADERQGTEHLFFVQPEEVRSGRYADCVKRIRSLEQRTYPVLAGRIGKSSPVSLKPTSLAYAIDRLQHIDLCNSSRDVKGLAFQKFINAEHRRGRGQFFTPEQVVDLCVRFLRPSHGERILDPACGTGGFLTQAASFLSGNEESTNGSDESLIVGIEINPMVAATAEVRMALEDASNVRIVTADALADWSNLNHHLNERLRSNCSYENYFDVVLTNPPFGSQGRIRSKEILERFDLGHKWTCHEDICRRTSSLQGGQVPDILFIERCLDFLKVGGRMAVVVPNGDLENSSLSYFRHYIRSRARVLAVVHLPHDTFVPFGTGVKASILFLEKSGSTEQTREGSVFFGQITKLGYQANKNGSAVYRKCDKGTPLLDNFGTPLVDEDFTELAERFEHFVGTGTCEPTDSSFTVQCEDLADRFDLEFYKPSHRELEERLLKLGAKPLDQVARIVKRRSPKLHSGELEVLYIELGNVNVAYAEISGGSQMKVHELPSRASFEIHTGDIITAVAGNSTGTDKHMSALVTEEYDGAICTNGFRILQPLQGINRHYLLYYLRTRPFLRQVYRYRTGAAIPAVSDEDLARVLVYIPPQDEQQRIAERVQESFKLRQRSRDVLRDMEFSLHESA